MAWLEIIAVILSIVGVFWWVLSITEKSNRERMSEVENTILKMESDYEHHVTQKLYLAAADSQNVSGKNLLDSSFSLLRNQLLSLYLLIENIEVFGSGIKLKTKNGVFDNIRTLSAIMVEELHRRKKGHGSPRLSPDEKGEFVRCIMEAMQSDLLKRADTLHTQQVEGFSLEFRVEDVQDDWDSYEQRVKDKS